MAIYISPLPPVEIPDTPLAEFVLARARERGERAALIDALTGRTITYAQVPDLVDRAAASLSRLGIRQGDVCAIVSPNTPEFPIAALAIARLGAILTTASPLCTRDDLVRQFRDCGARLLLMSPAVAATTLPAAKEAGIDRVFSFAPIDGVDLVRRAGRAARHAAGRGRSGRTMSSRCRTRAARRDFRRACGCRIATWSRTCCRWTAAGTCATARTR